MSHIELSFCIPTYNRAESVHRLVTTILTCADPSIEVVVLDNGSTDNTLQILQSIDDERLVVNSNGENKGALFNMVNVLDKGRGRFLVYVTDKDDVNPNKIDAFKSFLLSHPDLAGGYCTFDPIYEAQWEIFPQGYQAIQKIAYQGRHPTGYFFNNEFLKSIKLVERFSDYGFVDLFPLEFVFAELCLRGPGAIYHKPIFTPETRETIVKYKSATTNGNSKKAYFLPEARMKLAINYTKHIYTLPLVPKEMDLLIIGTFMHELTAATMGYRAILNNKDLCTHYYMECRNIGGLELIRIGINFYRQFVKETKNLWKENSLRRLKFKARITMRIVQKIIGLFSKRFSK